MSDTQRFEVLGGEDGSLTVGELRRMLTQGELTKNIFVREVGSRA